MLTNAHSCITTTISKIQNIATAPRNFLMPLCNQYLPPTHTSPWQSPDLFPIPIILPFPEFYVNAVIHYVVFWMWFLSLGIMHLRFTYVILSIGSALFIISKYYSIVWMYHSLSIHQLKDVRVVCHFLVIMSKSTENTSMHIIVETCFHFLWINI